MPEKFKIIMSDLHLSAGRVAEGNLLEDFGSDQEFAALLDDVVAESERDGAEVELIFNGDVFEMLQVPHVAEFSPSLEYPAEQYHSSSEADSVLKMAIIVEGHRPFFEALGRFLRVGPPRRHVTFIKGNHDLNLHWAGVQSVLCEALGARSGRQSLVAFEERLICREGIYVEHGNQYAEKVDRVEDMEEPHDPDDPTQLAIPLGSWFVMNVFNQVEREKYWIDGVKPITALVWYALKFDFRFAIRAIAQLTGSLPGVLWEGLGAAGLPSMDVMDQHLAEPGQVDALAGRYESDDAFRLQLNAELAELLGAPIDAPEWDLRDRGGADNPVTMGDRVRKRVDSSLYDMAAAKAADEGVRLVSFGHTHDAGVEELPGGGRYINSGTWTWRADLGSRGKETWKELFTHPERFTEDRVLSYVRVDYDQNGQPWGELRTFELAGDGPGIDILEEIPSIWHRIEEWFRRLTGALGL